jgi:hypothetical protein
VLSRKTTNTNFIVFGWTRAGLKPTTYRTRGKHTNHYTAVVVDLELNPGHIKPKPTCTKMYIGNICVFLFSVFDPSLEDCEDYNQRL